MGQIHPKAFAYLKNWGVEYLTIKCTPGTLRDSPWLINGPFRFYETQRSGASLLPLFYADFLTVPGHPEFAGQFFDCVTEIRDDSLSSVGEWGPDGNDIPGPSTGAPAISNAPLTAWCWPHSTRTNGAFTPPAKSAPPGRRDFDQHE